MLGDRRVRRRVAGAWSTRRGAGAAVSRSGPRRSRRAAPAGGAARRRPSGRGQDTRSSAVSPGSSVTSIRSTVASGSRRSGNRHSSRTSDSAVTRTTTPPSTASAAARKPRRPAGPTTCVVVHERTRSRAPRLRPGRRRAARRGVGRPGQRRGDRQAHRGPRTATAGARWSRQRRADHGPPAHHRTVASHGCVGLVDQHQVQPAAVERRLDGHEPVGVGVAHRVPGGLAAAGRVHQRPADRRPRVVELPHDRPGAVLAERPQVPDAQSRIARACSSCVKKCQSSNAVMPGCRRSMARRSFTRPLPAFWWASIAGASSASAVLPHRVPQRPPRGRRLVAVLGREPGPPVAVLGVVQVVPDLPQVARCRTGRRSGAGPSTPTRGSSASRVGRGPAPPPGGAAGPASSPGPRVGRPTCARPAPVEPAPGRLVAAVPERPGWGASPGGRSPRGPRPRSPRRCRRPPGSRRRRTRKSCQTRMPGPVAGVVEGVALVQPAAPDAQQVHVRVDGSRDARRDHAPA